MNTTTQRDISQFESRKFLKFLYYMYVKFANVMRLARDYDLFKQDVGPREVPIIIILVDLFSRFQNQACDRNHRCF